MKLIYDYFLFDFCKKFVPISRQNLFSVLFFFLKNNAQSHKADYHGLRFVTFSSNSFPFLLLVYAVSFTFNNYVYISLFCVNLPKFSGSSKEIFFSLEKEPTTPLFIETFRMFLFVLFLLLLPVVRKKREKKS